MLVTVLFTKHVILSYLVLYVVHYVIVNNDGKRLRRLLEHMDISVFKRNKNRYKSAKCTSSISMACKQNFTSMGFNHLQHISYNISFSVKDSIRHSKFCYIVILSQCISTHTKYKNHTDKYYNTIVFVVLLQLGFPESHIYNTYK